MTADAFEAAFVGGTIVALRNRANAQRKIAHDGTTAAGERYPGVQIGSPESAFAARLAADWDDIADRLAAGR